MICKACIDAADRGQFGAEAHKACRGFTWCDCAHKDKGLNNDRETEEEGQSPTTNS